MKKNIIIIIVLVFIGLGAVYKFIKSNKELLVPSIKKGLTEEKIIYKDEFQILLPQGWREINPMANGVSMSAWDEKISEEDAAKKINYHANYNVTYGKLEEQSKDDYLKMMKEQIKTLAPSVNFINEKSNSFEAELRQQNVDFKALIVLVFEKNNDVWNISFNAPKSEYEKYKPIFEKVAESFLAK